MGLAGLKRGRGGTWLSSGMGRAAERTYVAIFLRRRRNLGMFGEEDLMRAPRSTYNPSGDVAISPVNSENFTSHSQIVAPKFFEIRRFVAVVKNPCINDDIHT